MTRAHRTWPVLLVLALGPVTPAAHAQPPDPAEPAEPALAVAPTPLTLEQCIQIGLQRQPSLAAARASLAAAADGQRALENLRLAALLSREIPVRRRQAALGVAIASAGLEQAEWETTYAVTRTYFTVLYARRQEGVARGLVEKLRLYREKAIPLVKKGDPDTLVTQVDVDRLSTNVDLFELRHLQATNGMDRALAALREAIGLEPGCPVVLADGDLPSAQDVPCRDELLAMALARRGELVQAGNAAEVTELEVEAQATSRRLTRPTFAAGADIHSRQIPQGIANREYRPSAIGLDMPTMLAGHKADRMARARDLSARAGAVVEKTRNLIALELDDSYLKWREASQQLKALASTSAKATNVLKSTEARFEIGRVSGEDIIRAKTLDSQVQAEYNEALFNQALALAALERITAGGFSLGHRPASGHE